MAFDFRPEFHIDFKLEVVWPKLKGAFRGIASALRGLVLPAAGPSARGSLARACALVLGVLALVAGIVAAVAAYARR